ncbi:MAG: hypothetical protein ACRDDX_02935 [Cellulosilyticaceae bacterium]
MERMYIALIIICIVAIGVLMLNIGVVGKKEYPVMKWVCMILFAFSMTRYLTLIVYGDSPSLGQLEALKYFYLATSIGLTIPMASVVWYITPHLREKITYPKYLAFFIPWIVFYLFVLVTQPTQIEMGESFGYTLTLVGEWPKYLSIAQGSFVFVVLSICLWGLWKYKNSHLRSQYLALILALVALTLDGLGYFIPTLSIFPPFTVSEVLGFLAIGYGFAGKPLKTYK